MKLIAAIDGFETFGIELIVLFLFFKKSCDSSGVNEFIIGNRVKLNCYLPLNGLMLKLLFHPENFNRILKKTAKLIILEEKINS
jgi:hypothetical protein